MLTDPTPTASLILGLPPAVFAAVIAASTAVVVAVLGQFVTSRREQHARRDERRRRAVTELQDAALEVRAALREYGLALRSGLARAPGPGAVRVDVDTGRLHAAAGLVDVRLVRLSKIETHRQVDGTLLTWRDTAEVHFTNPREVTATQEQQDWLALHRAVGAALD